MANLKIKKGFIKSEITVPSSKSYANRALILGSLQNRELTLKNVPLATDVTVLIENLKKIGLKINQEGSALTILNSFPACETSGMTLMVGEGGTTARFLAAMLLRGTKQHILVLGDRLKDRPWGEFIHFARKYGAVAELQDNKLIVQGPLKMPTEVLVDCTRTTQFATAFQLAFAWTGTKVIPVNAESSQSYLTLTENVISLISKTQNYTIPLDWSSASYPMAFASLNHKVSFANLVFDSFQSDAKMLKILQAFDALMVTPKGILVKPLGHVFAAKLDVSDALDLVPTLSFLLSHIEGQHELSGIKNLVFKESNRLEEIIKLLAKFKRKAWAEDNVLYIVGSKEKLTEEIDLVLPNDHRIVMIGALFLRHHGGGSVQPKEAVEKSYPEFYQIMAD